MSDASPIISIEGVSRLYKRYRHPRDRALEALGIKMPGSSYDEFWALRDINIQINQGERIGLIGRNGAGKSTLLNIVCGQLQPTTGRAVVRGKVQALMELGTGFHPEFSGRQNVISSLAYQGVTGAQARAMLDEIIDFSELDDFIDQPVKTYSAGMYARLAFSTATAIRPEVLIVDEILGAGDAYFNAKCTERMRRLTEDTGATVLFVSHDISSVQALCTRAIWLEKGGIRMEGDTFGVSKSYYASVLRQEEERLRARTTSAIARMRKVSGTATDAAGDASQLLFRLTGASGEPVRGNHAIASLELALPDGERLSLSPGTAADTDAQQPAYLIADPRYMLWMPAIQSAGRPAREVGPTGGSYGYAPFCFKLPKDRAYKSAELSVTHAAGTNGEAIAVDYYDGSEFKRLGELAPGDGWKEQRFPVVIDRSSKRHATMRADDAAFAEAEGHPVGSDATSVQDMAVSTAAKHASAEASGDSTPLDRWGTDEGEFVRAESVDAVTGETKVLFGKGETLAIECVVRARTFLPSSWLCLIVYDERGNRVTLIAQPVGQPLAPGIHTLRASLKNPSLRQGEYVVTIELLPEFDFHWQGPGRLPYICHWDRCVFFRVDEQYQGTIELGLVDIQSKLDLIVG